MYGTFKRTIADWTGRNVLSAQYRSSISFHIYIYADLPKESLFYNLCICNFRGMHIWVWYLVVRLSVYLEYIGDICSFYERNPDINTYNLHYSRCIRSMFWVSVLAAVFPGRRTGGRIFLLGIRNSLRFTSLCR